MQKLVDIIKHSGKETSTHCERVAQYVKIFFSKDNYGYTPQQIQYIINGAYLHDIGKSAIDKSILYKTSKITEDEMNILRRHSAYGYEILTKHKTSFSSDEEYEICRNIALMHHRRLNNTGYPIIPDQELDDYIQIVSILDVFDALTSERCYQKPVTREEALRIIDSGAGGFFSEELRENLRFYIQKII